MSIVLDPKQAFGDCVTALGMAAFMIVAIYSFLGSRRVYKALWKNGACAILGHAYGDWSSWSASWRHRDYWSRERLCRRCPTVETMASETSPNAWPEAKGEP